MIKMTSQWRLNSIMAHTRNVIYCVAGQASEFNFIEEIGFIGIAMCLTKGKFLFSSVELAKLIHES